MASFIRKVPTASGARAVQIVHKQGRQVVRIEHIGSVHDEVQLAVLMEVARARLLPDQDTVDLASPSATSSTGAGASAQVARDNRTLNAQEARARALVDGEKAARTPRFVKTTADARVLDETALVRARRVAGLNGYITNIPATVMDAAEVISSYHDLWHVEQSFRMSKTDLQARPLFARTRDAIEAHLTIVFTALVISRTVQDRTGASIRKVLRELRPLHSATIEINGATRTYPPAVNHDRQALIDAIRTPTPRH